MTTFWATMLLQTPKNPRFCAKVFICKTLLNMAWIRIWVRNFSGSTSLFIDPFILCKGGGGGGRLLDYCGRRRRGKAWVDCIFIGQLQIHHISAAQLSLHMKKIGKIIARMNYRPENIFISNRMNCVRNKYPDRLKTCPVSGTYRNC
jgi:hypothetical protein